MLQDGFIPRTYHQVKLYSTIGTKRYRQLSQVGFNMAYAEYLLNREPKHGSYQADMLHAQSLAEKIAYEHCVASEFNEGWFRGFIDELSEDACTESLLQRTAYEGLEAACRDDSFNCPEV